MFDKWTTNPSRQARQSFPPYELCAARQDPAFLTGIEAAEEKTRRLARLYQHTLTHGWDHREVLDALVAKHGGIRVPEAKKPVIARIFSVLMWGELAAWNVAADLAAGLSDVGAKMAVTGQVFDEARHFLVLREYLERAGITPAPLNPMSRRIMVKVLTTSSVAEKLYGMQLTVEICALSIFKRLGEIDVEPVLTELLPYLEKDEGRHVGLGVMYLPQLLSSLGRVERARLALSSLETFVFTMFSGKLMEPDFTALGISQRELAFANGQIWERIMKQMREASGLKEGDAIEGIKEMSPSEVKRFVDAMSPEDMGSISASHRLFLRLFEGVVNVAAYAMS